VSRRVRTVEIERLVLDGLDVSRSQAEEIRLAVEKEAGRLLGDRPARQGGDAGNGGAELPRLKIEDRLDTRALAAGIARHVSRAVPASDLAEGRLHG
jgi:hypothetical protein